MAYLEPSKYKLYGAVCVQDIAKFQHSFSQGAEELLMTTKIPTNLSCVHSACVLDPEDTHVG